MVIELVQLVRPLLVNPQHVEGRAEREQKKECLFKNLLHPLFFPPSAARSENLGTSFGTGMTRIDVKRAQRSNVQ